MKDILAVREQAARLGAFRLVYALETPLSATLEEISGPEVIVDEDDEPESPTCPAAFFDLRMTDALLHDFPIG